MTRTYVPAPGPRGDQIEICGDCGQRHVTHMGTQACKRHVVHDRSTYVKGQPRQRLPEPRPCKGLPVNGTTMCRNHGAAAPNIRKAAERRVAEDKAEAAVLRKLGGAGEPVTDPIGKLCSIAGRAVDLMEGLGERVDKLDDLNTDQARANVVVYSRAIDRAASVVESIIRMGIAERLAKQDAQRTDSWVAFIDAVVTGLGHNPRDPQVAGVIAANLELLAS